MSTNKQLRIAVVGAGIAGASLAVALKAKGLRADVYEQAPQLGEVGAGIGVRTPSVVALKKWGLWEALEKVTCESPRMQIVGGEDTVFIEETWPVLVDDDSVSINTRLIHRADLLDLLKDAIPEDQIHLSYHLEKTVEHEDYVELFFANGERVEADIVIAADGIRSRVRNDLIEHVEPIYSGYLAHRVLIDFDAALGKAFDDNTLRIYVDGDNSYYMLPLLKNRRQVSVDITIPGAFSWRPEITKEQLLEGIKGFAPTLQKVIENAPMETIISRPLCDIEPLTTWTTNRVALIGDAAHAMLHNQGQGANMAMQDADVLADVLEEAANGALTPQAALKKYEELRIPPTKLYQELSRLFPTDQAKTAFPEKAHLSS